MKQHVQPRAQRKWKIVLLCLALMLVGWLILWNLRIDTIEVEGGDFYTEQEIRDYLFGSPLEQNYIYASIKNRWGQKKDIPFVAGYTLEFEGTDHVTVTIYEKEIIGYINYMGSHMYFDKDGTVVESSSTLLWEDIPLITGLDFSSIVLYKPLPVADPSAFTQILNLTQLIHKHKIRAHKIYFDNRLEATLYVDQIRVMLGDKSYMEDKMAELAGMLPQLKGMAGTLYLDGYDPSAMNPYYSFMKDEVPEEPAEETGSGEEP